MPLKYWDEAFIAAVYLINRLPTKLLNFSAPLEILEKIKPDYASMRIFGCACYPNLRPFNARKLQYRSIQCTFLGYSNLHKGFKCLDIKSGRIYISRDVIFDETVFPFSHLHANAGQRLREEILLLPSHLVNSPTIDPRGENRNESIVANDPLNPANDFGEFAENTSDTHAAQDGEDAENTGATIPLVRDFMLPSSVQRFGTEAQGHAGPTAYGARETASPRSPAVTRDQPGTATPARQPLRARVAPAGGPHPRVATASSGSSASTQAPASSHTAPTGSTASDSSDPGADLASDTQDSPAVTAGRRSSAPDAPGDAPVPRMSTRLQTGKIQPKQYRNMVKFANLTTTGEPENLADAFKNKKWKDGI
jgi:hypothetical protein